MIWDRTKIMKGLMNPRHSWKHTMLTLTGFYYKAKFRILGMNVRIGSSFRVRGKLSIKGPGRVSIGDNVFIDGSWHPVTPWTYSEAAEISIGNDVFLNGTRFGCLKRIAIGDHSIIADCRIMDTDFHSIYPDRRNDSSSVESGPIEIGRNVWVALDCVILKGVRIGDNSTISARSLVLSDVPDHSVYGGHPAVLIKKLTINQSKTASR